MSTQPWGLSRTSSLFKKIDNMLRSFSASGRAFFYFFSTLLIVSSLGLVYILNNSLLVATPALGGTLREGVVGVPRFINPVLAISDADHDLTSLTYSGLVKATPSGTYINDLAESYTISPDGRVYTFIIKKNATFQDGVPVTADDIVFTILKTQNPSLKSPVRANWNRIIVEKVDARTVTFTLRQAYAPFIENVSLGILPKHLWDKVSDDEFSFSALNTIPVGAGPYRAESVTRTSSGIPNRYILTAYPKYVLGTPFISKLDFYFYANEDDRIDALKKGEVEAVGGVSPTRTSELSGLQIEHAPLNRVFAVFFNQNQNEALRDTTARQALSDAVDREALVHDILGGFGRELVGPLPPGLLAHTGGQAQPAPLTKDLVVSAKNELIRAGWTPGQDGILQKTIGSGKTAKVVPLTFTITTGNVPELRAAAAYLRQTWGDMGAQVTVQVFDQGDLTQNVIRPRKYDALLFGEVVGREPDLFAFWHSSERLDPGLNVALYTNSVVDKLLEQLRITQDEDARTLLYSQFTDAIKKDVPAAFLYAPDFVYIVPKDIKGLELGFIETPSDRFLSITGWHRQTDFVWPIFSRTRSQM